MFLNSSTWKLFCCRFWNAKNHLRFPNMTNRRVYGSFQWHNSYRHVFTPIWFQVSSLFTPFLRKEEQKKEVLFSLNACYFFFFLSYCLILACIHSPTSASCQVCSQSFHTWPEFVLASSFDPLVFHSSLVGQFVSPTYLLLLSRRKRDRKWGVSDKERL